MKTKVMSLAIAFLIVVSASAMMVKYSLPNATSSNLVQEKPKCSQIVNETVCGGNLELSFTAYKEITDKECPFCKGKGKNCNYSHCDNGKLWEWRSAYVCQKCKALYDVEEIQKQM